MKVRMKFVKTGPIRYVGHLDFMRYFTKAVQRSGLPGVYTGGFSPHLIISFGAPLGVGEETLGDYADVELAYRDPWAKGDELYRLQDIGLDNDALPDAPSQDEILRMMNSVFTEGVRLVGVSRIGQIKTDKVMALARYARYSILLKDSFLPDLNEEHISDKLNSFYGQKEIIIHKKTKKSEKDVDIRPLITEIEAAEVSVLPETLTGRSGFRRRRRIELVCAAGSTQNLKPSAVVEAFCRFCSLPYDPYGYTTVRIDTYDEQQISLGELGKKLTV